MKFSNWLINEKKDIFGFERELKKGTNRADDEMPLKPVNIEKLIEMCARHPIGQRYPRIKFVNEVHWGEGPGSLRVWLGTGLNLMIDRLGTDLTGTPRWITKKIYQINRDGYGGHEESIAEEVLEKLQVIDEQEPDSPKNDYKELEQLVVQMSSSLRRVAKDIFLFEGVRKLSDTSYIIRFSVRGHGIEAQDQQRVEENQTHITYDKESGAIRLTNYNIESPVGKAHEWLIMPTDTDIYFFPTQSRDEIIETIANTMHWY